MEDCVFCKIIKSEIPSHNVYEDGDVLAFTSNHPINEGHILVVPKKHVPVFQDLEEVDYQKVMAVVKKLSKAVNSAFAPKKVGLLVAGWDIPHAHVHIVPMNKFDDLTTRSHFEGTEASPTQDEMKSTAEKIRKVVS